VKILNLQRKKHKNFSKKDEIPLDNKQTASTTESKDNTPLADKEETAESLFDMIE